ncbi:MAG: lipid-binding SYLF domain-containing protein [Rhodospirillales bacterium]|nr:lipid-binding SYLF domain-containing protein [Rhodospirillales bacterium]
MDRTRRALLLATPAALGAIALAPRAQAAAESGAVINHRANLAIAKLYAQSPKARELDKKALGVLVFPEIIKAGLIVGGQSGNGVLWVHGKTVGFYNLSSASFGLQAGAQTFSYALFFMTQSSLDYLRKSDGWSVGSGPSVVVMDKSAAASMSSTTLTQDVYAFPFGGRGLMAGIGLDGSKITQIHPGP